MKTIKLVVIISISLFVFSCNKEEENNIEPSATTSTNVNVSKWEKFDKELHSPNIVDGSHYQRFHYTKNPKNGMYLCQQGEKTITNWKWAETVIFHLSEYKGQYIGNTRIDPSYYDKKAKYGEHDCLLINKSFFIEHIPHDKEYQGYIEVIYQGDVYTSLPFYFKNEPNSKHVIVKPAHRNSQYSTEI